MPTPPIFAYNFSATLSASHFDADVWDLASCEMCAIVLCNFWERACSGVVNTRFSRSRLMSTHKLGIKMTICLFETKL